MLDLLVCTVGTSLASNLRSQQSSEHAVDEYASVVSAYESSNWQSVGWCLRGLDGQARICGAEINSIDSMISRGLIAPDTALFFLHSDTNAGRNIAQVLCGYYGKRAQSCQIDGLQDERPRDFRTRGLRNLAKQMCRILLDHRYTKCGINATGGYKAQIAVATLIGQAISVPVYYKHESFDEVIEFPPMPVALDFEYWMSVSGILLDLAKTTDLVRSEDYEETLDGDERVESLIERVDVEGQQYIELSPVGQIFLETFRNRFESERDRVLPPPVPTSEKRDPKWEDSGHMRSNPEIMDFMSRVMTAMPFVKQCSTWYFNPDLPARTHFRKSAQGVEGVISNGTYTAKFRVDTSATTDGQMSAAVAALNVWLEGDSGM